MNAAAHRAARPVAPARWAGVRTLLTGPLFALQFLTVAPPLIRRPARAGELGPAEAFFPLVGLLLGCGLAAIDLLLAPLFTSTVRDVMLVTALAVMTGALHLDGVLDTFDGLFGGRDAEARLAVMRDPHAGAFGVVAVGCLLLLKVAALGALPGQLRAVALLIAPCLGRWAIVEATWLFRYARREGLGRAFKDELRPHHAALAGAAALVAAVWLLGPLGAVLFGVASVAVWLAGAAIAGRLGGLTGDTYGALCELVETGAWLALGLPLLWAGS